MMVPRPLYALITVLALAACSPHETAPDSAPASADIERAAEPRPPLPQQQTPANPPQAVAETAPADTLRGRLDEARALADRGELTRAIAAFDAILRDVPDLAEALLARGDAKRRGHDRPGAIVDYLAALRLDPRSPARDALDALEVTAVVYAPTAPDPFVAIGLPAISEDGALVATAWGAFEITRTSDSRRVFDASFDLGAEPLGDAGAPPPSTLRTSRGAATESRIAAQLAAHAWHRLDALIPPEESYHSLEPVSFASDDGALSVRYVDPELTLELAGVRWVTRLAWSRPKPVRKPPGVYDVDQDPEGDACVPTPVLASAGVDAARTRLVFEVIYVTIKYREPCGAPKPALRVMVIPSMKSHAGWRALRSSGGD